MGGGACASTVAKDVDVTSARMCQQNGLDNPLYGLEWDVSEGGADLSKVPLNGLFHDRRGSSH